MTEINYLEIIILLILVVGDYYLTIYSDVLRKKKYSSYFNIDNYELNPVWIKDINKRKLFNFKHLLIVACLVFLIVTIQQELYRSDYYKLLYGALFSIFFIIDSRHISNILIFKFVIKNPKELKGQVSLSQKYIYIASAYQTLVCVGAIIPLAYLSRSYYVYGGLSAAILLIIVQIIWYRKYRTQEQNLATLNRSR